MNDALFGALIGGGATCLVTYLTLHYQERMAREQLLQSRFAPAYLTLQIYISKWADHATWTVAPIQLSPTPEPQLPEISDVETAQASLFASDDAIKAMNEFIPIVLRYRLEVGRLAEARATQDKLGTVSPEITAAWEALQTAGNALVASAENVHQKLRQELRGKRQAGTSQFWQPEMLPSQ